jgi:hypothetical protein
LCIQNFLHLGSPGINSEKLPKNKGSKNHIIFYLSTSKLWNLRKTTKGRSNQSSKSSKMAISRYEPLNKIESMKRNAADNLRTIDNIKKVFVSLTLIAGFNIIAAQELPADRPPVEITVPQVEAGTNTDVVEAEDTVLTTTQPPTEEVPEEVIPEESTPPVGEAVVEEVAPAVELVDQEVAEVVAPEPPVTDARPDQSTPQTVANTPVFTQCQVDAQNVKAMQQKIFELKENGDGNVSLMELLVIQDELKAREAVVKGLIGVWDEYNNYLTENEQLRQDSSNNHLNAKNAIGALNKIKGFIDNNSQAVSRYHLLSEAFSQFDPAQFQGKTKEEVFAYVKSSMQSACQDPQKSTALGYCQEASRAPNFWSMMTPQAVAATNPQNSSDIIHKFIEVTSVSARDWGPTDNWVENLSTLFVDDSSINGDLLADENLSEIVSGMIEDTVNECRKQALVSSDREVDCLEDSRFIEGHPQRQLLTQKLNLLNPGQNKEYRNMQDIVDAYLENAQKVSSAHHENVGGTITDLANIASQRAEISQQIAQGNSAIQADLEAARADLKVKANVKMATIGRNLDSIQDSKKVFANYMNTVPGLELGSSQAANQIINDLMGPNAPGDIFQLTADETFKITDEAYDKIFTDPNFSKENLTALLNTPQDKYYGKSIMEAKADIAGRIASIKATQEYKDAEAFKNFAWESLLTTCKKDSDTNVQEIVQPTCQEGSMSEVSSLLQVGSSLISFQSNRDDQMEVASLNRRCQELYNESPSEYAANGYTALCNEINRTDISNTRRATQDSARTQRRANSSRRRRIYYEDDGITPSSAYTPKSNFALFLPAAASAFTTILPMWSQTPLYQSYALQGKYAGYREKDYNAWLQARNQSIANQTVCINGVFNCFLPSTVTPGVSATLGNSAFSFGQSSTVFGSTTTGFTGF